MSPPSGSPPSYHQRQDFTDFGVAAFSAAFSNFPAYPTHSIFEAAASGSPTTSMQPLAAFPSPPSETVSQNLLTTVKPEPSFHGNSTADQDPFQGLTQTENCDWIQQNGDHS